MTGASPAGEAIWITVKNIMAKEGPGALMKGCFPRMLWIAPLGAMNFAGYELAKRAMQAADDPDTAKKKEPEKAIKIAPEIPEVVEVPANEVPAAAAPTTAPAAVAETPSASKPHSDQATTPPAEASDVSETTAPVKMAETPAATEAAPAESVVASATSAAKPAASKGFRSLPPASPK